MVIFPLDVLYDLVFKSNTTRVWIESPEESFALIASPGRWSALVPALHLSCPRVRPKMSPDKLFEAFLIFVPILFLLAVGGIIALRSGVGELETGRDYMQIAGNLSQMILRVVGYVALLLAVQYLIGLRPSIGWGVGVVFAR